MMQKRNTGEPALRICRAMQRLLVRVLRAEQNVANEVLAGEVDSSACMSFRTRILALVWSLF